MPHAAPTASRLSAIAFSGMTTERKVEQGRKAGPSTNANTIGTRAFSSSLKSFVRGQARDRRLHTVHAADRAWMRDERSPRGPLEIRSAPVPAAGC